MRIPAVWAQAGGGSSGSARDARYLLRRDRDRGLGFSVSLPRFPERPDGRLVTLFHFMAVADFWQSFSRPSDDHLGVAVQRRTVLRPTRGDRDHRDRFQQADGHGSIRSGVLSDLVERRIYDLRERDGRNDHPELVLLVKVIRGRHVPLRQAA